MAKRNNSRLAVWVALLCLWQIFLACDCPNICHSLFFSSCCHQNRRPCFLPVRGNTGSCSCLIVTVCSPCYFLCLLYFVFAGTLVYIISTRPVSLCIPMTRSLLFHCFSCIVTILAQLTKSKTIEKQKQDCQIGYHPSGKCSQYLLLLKLEYYKVTSLV